MNRGRIVRYTIRSFFFLSLVLILSLTHPLTAQGDPEPPWNSVPVSVPAMNYQPPLDADDLNDFLPPGYVYINATTIPTPTIIPTGTLPLPTETVSLPGGSPTALPSITPILPTETVPPTSLPSVPPITPTIPTPSGLLTGTVTPPPTTPITDVVVIPETGAGALFHDQQVALIVEDPTFNEAMNIHFAPEEVGPVTATHTISSPMGTTTLLRFHIEASSSTGIPHNQFEHPVRLVIDLRDVLASNSQLPDLDYDFWLAYRDETDPSIWHEVPTILHQADGLLSAEVPHFSEWASGVRPERWNPEWNWPTVSEFSGAATYSHPLETPPGRNGLQPSLVLSYSSRGTDGQIQDPEPGAIADGWSLADISIIRVGVRTEPCPSNNSFLCQIHPNDYRLVLNGTGHELVTFDANHATGTEVRFYARNAPQLRITRYYNVSAENQDKLFWVVETPDGTKYRLGYKAAAEAWQSVNFSPYLVVDGHTGYNNHYSATAWYVDTVTDASGNQMQYRYNQEEFDEEMGNFDLTTNKTRILSIRYNYTSVTASVPVTPTVPWLTSSYATEIKFHAPGDNQAQNATDPITRILIFHGSLTAPIKEYRLGATGYQTVGVGCQASGGGNLTTNTRVLNTIRLFVGTDSNPHSDNDAGPVYALPPISFTYTAKPHFHKNNQACFSYPYMTQMTNGYGGNVTFQYKSDGRAIGSYQVLTSTIKWPDIGYSYYVTKTVMSDGWNSNATLYDYKTPCYAQNNSNVGSGGIVCPAYSGEYRPEYGTIMGFDVVTTTVKGYAGENLTRRVANYDVADDDTLGMNEWASSYMWDSSSQTFKIVAKTINDPTYVLAPARFAYNASTTQYQYQPGNTSVYLATVVTDQYETSYQGGDPGEFFGHLTRRDYAYWYNSGWVTYRHDTFRYRVRQDDDYWLLLPWRNDVYDGSWVRMQLGLTYYDGATTNPDSATLTKGRPTLSRALMIDAPISASRWYTIDTQYTYDTSYGNQTEIKVNPDYGEVWHEVDGGGNPTDYWKYTQLPDSSTEQKTTITYDSTYHLYPLTVKQEGASGGSDDLTTTFQVYGFNGVSLDGWQKQAGLLKQVTNPNGLLTIYEYDPFGRLSATYENASDRGNLSTLLDGDPLVRYRYWDNGWNQATWNGQELIPVVYLDPANNDPFMITTHTRPGSFNSTNPGYEFRTQTFFDGLGRVIQEQNTYQEVHDPDTSSLQQKDVVTRTKYNAQGLATCQTVPYVVALYNQRATFPDNPYVSGNCTSYDYTATIYDTLGRPLTVTSPGGQVSTYAYGVTTSITSFGHDRLTITRLQDANDHVVRQYQNALGQLVLVKEYTDEYPSEDEYADTRYEYDILGNLTGVGTSAPISSQPGSWLRLSEMTYDAFGRKVTMDDPDMGDWNYTYDALGNLTSQTDAEGQTLCFWVDRFNRPTDKRHDSDDDGCESSDALLSQTSYYAPSSGAATGQMAQVLWPDSSNRETFTYNSRGLLASHTRWIAGTSYTMGYSNFDKLNRPETLTYPNGENVTLTYDHEGEKSIAAGGTTLVSDIWYNKQGQMTEVFRGNNVRTTYDYAGANGDFRLENVYTRRFVYPLTTDLLDFDYTYNSVGNVTHIFEDVSNDSQWFGYDELNRLTSAYTTGGPAAYNHTYTYDELGNLQSRSETVGSTTTGFDLTYNTGAQNQPQAVVEVQSTDRGGTLVYDLTYDDNGNMTERVDHLAGKTYIQGFDVENRLISVTLSSGTPMTTTFRYDTGGQRTQTISYDSSTSRTVTQYPFPNYEVERAQSWQYSCSIDPCGYIWVTTQTTTRSTYFLTGQAIATRVNGTLYHLHSDHLGSTSLMTNSSGGSVSNTTARYLPYGGYRTTPTAGLTERGYTGHHENRYIKLIYMNARWYDPQIGRFVSADTIVPQENNPQSFNRYSYVLNRPTILVDPSGHESEDATQESLQLPEWWLQWKNEEIRRVQIEGYGLFDLGHINRGYEAALSIIQQVRDKVASGGGIVEYGSTGGFLRKDYEAQWWVSGDLTEEQIIGVALGIYMDFELGYESHQSKRIDFYSAYSPEDLPSDYIGFWAAANGFEKDDIPWILEGLGDVAPYYGFSAVLDLETADIPLGTFNANIAGPQQIIYPTFPRNHQFTPMAPGSSGWGNVDWPSPLQMTPIESSDTTWKRINE